MKANLQNLSVEQGTTYKRILRFYTSAARTNRIDLTGYEFKAQVRAEWNKELRVEIDFTLTDAEEGEVELEITPEKTRDLKPAIYKWDMLVTDPAGKILKYTKGAFELLPTQTKIEDE